MRIGPELEHVNAVSAYGSKDTSSFALALSISLLVLLAGAWLVLGCWYPRPFWSASGVLSLSAYAVTIHLGITALLVLPWRSRHKAQSRIVSDIAVLLWILLLAALFSLSVLASVRPVALVYAVDRVVMVRANEVRNIELAWPDLAIQRLRWSGPLRLLEARPSSDRERFDSIQLALAGFDLPQRPARWMSIRLDPRGLLDKAQPVEGGRGLSRQPPDAWLMDGVRLTHHLPLDGAKGEWVLAIDEQLRAYAPFKVD